MIAAGRKYEGWSDAHKQSVARQVPLIKHWKIIYGDYSCVKGEATWFVDPPYQVAGKYYKHKNIDYVKLGEWCRQLEGQAIVCENVGADWLPFKPFAIFQGAFARPGSQEALWTNE